MSMLFAVFFRGGWQKICYLLYVKEVFVGKNAKKLGVLALFALCFVFFGCESKEAKEERIAKQAELAKRDSLIKRYNLQEHTSGSVDSIMAGTKAAGYVDIKGKAFSSHELISQDERERLLKDPKFLRKRDSLREVYKQNK
jgi:hypothetical protein